jgi:hypothetical protein
MLIVVAILLFLLLQGGISKIIFPRTTSTTTTGTSLSALPVSITVHPTAAGLFEAFNYNTTHPVSVTFTVDPVGTSPFTYRWDFGDGTKSRSSPTTHVFPNRCGYETTLNVTDSLGHETSFTLLLNVFPTKGTAGTMVACPRQGTAGITQVKLAGGLYKKNKLFSLFVNSRPTATTIKADNEGSWILDFTGDLRPMINGSLYRITTSPSSVTTSFLTLEGIKASPASGEPGDSFTLEGRSYPANTNVSIFLNGVSLGQAQSDRSGSFNAKLQVPASLHYAGTYKFTTSPPVLGASATFTVPVSTVTPAPPTSNLWWLLILLIVVIAVLVGFYLWRRRRRRIAAPGPAAGAAAGGGRGQQVNLHQTGLAQD